MTVVAVAVSTCAVLAWWAATGVGLCAATPQVRRGAGLGGADTGAFGGLMNWNGWMRQIHRWLSVAFTVGFVANLVAVTVAPEEPIVWVGLLALVPLLLLMGTGLYLFVLPYVGAWRRRSAG